MEKNSEACAGRWANERLELLTPGPEWQPDVGRGLAQFRKRQSASRMAGHRWLWAVMAATATACFCMTALPAPRALAQRCLNCSVALWQSFASGAPAATNLKPAKDRKPAPDFALTGASGQLVRLSDFKGKVVLLNFWATWCHGCKLEIPWFVEFQDQFRDRGFAVLGVSFDDDGWKSVRPYLAKNKINYPMMVGNDGVAAPYGGIQSLPMTIVIDKSGRVAAVHTGLVSKDTYKAEIEALL